MAYSQLAKYDSVIWKLIHIMIYFTSFNSKLESAFHKIVKVYQFMFQINHRSNISGLLAHSKSLNDQ